MWKGKYILKNVLIHELVACHMVCPNYSILGVNIYPI